MCFKCSSTVAVAKLSTAYTSRRPSATTTHATPTSYLELCSRRLPLAARPQAHGNVFDKSWTRAAATPQRDGRERRGHVHMREELLTELHIPQAGRVAKKEPMVVIDRDSKWRAAHRREGVGARRRTPRATRRIKEECEAELPPGYIAD